MSPRCTHHRSGTRTRQQLAVSLAMLRRFDGVSTAIGQYSSGSIQRLQCHHDRFNASDASPRPAREHDRGLAGGLEPRSRFSHAGAPRRAGGRRCAPSSYLLNLEAAGKVGLDAESVRCSCCGRPDRRNGQGRLRDRQDRQGAQRCDRDRGGRRAVREVTAVSRRFRRNLRADPSGDAGRPSRHVIPASATNGRSAPISEVPSQRHTGLRWRRTPFPL